MEVGKDDRRRGQVVVRQPVAKLRKGEGVGGRVCAVEHLGVEHVLVRDFQREGLDVHATASREPSSSERCAPDLLPRDSEKQGSLAAKVDATSVTGG